MAARTRTPPTIRDRGGVEKEGQPGDHPAEQPIRNALLVLLSR